MRGNACVFGCARLCVDRADGWAQGPADWGAAQTLSQMPPGRTGSSFVRRARRAGPGTRSLIAIATMKHNAHSYVRAPLVSCLCTRIFYSAIKAINTHPQSKSSGGGYTEGYRTGYMHACIFTGFTLIREFYFISTELI